MSWTRIATIAATALAIAATAAPPASGASAAPPATPSGCALPVFGPGSSYHPHIDRAGFTPNVTNPYFPLPVGTTMVYTGVKDDQSAVDLVAASARTRVVDGVRTRVVLDRLFLDGVLEERTSDYYAQDRCGNVWYFGEDTAELDSRGHVTSTEGSFHAGIDGAQPGVYMQHQPQLQRHFRQEWYQGQAEDIFYAVDLSVAVHVRFGSYSHALRTAETTALEPGVRDDKFYVRGIGEVVERAATGPTETLMLVDILR